MNKKENKWIVPVIVIAVLAFIITGSVMTIRFIKRSAERASEKANEALIYAAEDLYMGLTGEPFDLDEFAEKQESAKNAADISAIYGGWESDAYYEFREDGTYGWYKSSDDLTDNYYSGTISVLRGAEACDHLNISYDRVLTVMRNSEGSVGLDDIYCITCSPTYLVSSGVDKSDTLGGRSYDLLFVITGDDSAQGANVANGDTYYFTKIK